MVSAWRWHCDRSELTTVRIAGFAGYFDAQLYKDVHISINPPTFSEGMFSWFKYAAARSCVLVCVVDAARLQHVLPNSHSGVFEQG